MARKMSEKPHSIRFLRLFNFSQSGSRKTIKKPLKELPWSQQLGRGITYDFFHKDGTKCSLLSKMNDYILLGQDTEQSLSCPSRVKF